MRSEDDENDGDVMVIGIVMGHESVMKLWKRGG